MIYYVSIIAAILLLIYILWLVKKNKIDEKHSIFWIFFSVVLIILSLTPNILNYIASLLNVYYAPSILFLFGIIFIFSYCIHLSVILSKQNKMIIKLTQHIALIELKKINTTTDEDTNNKN